jgi:hypothetical protein
LADFQKELAEITVQKETLKEVSAVAPFTAQGLKSASTKVPLRL